MIAPDDAPPFAIYCAPYGGLGLKTRSYAAARQRIQGLLDSSTEVVHEMVELTVDEPASRALVEALAGGFDRDTAVRGGGSTRDDLAAVVAAQGHIHDPLAAEAWQRFGPPNRVGGRQNRGVFAVDWVWIVEDPARAPAHLDAFSPFASAHDQEMYDDYSTRVIVRSIWQMRLRVAGGKVVDPPYPMSEVHASLRGKHASAFLDLVLPHESATDAFLADYRAVNRALGMTVPMRGYKLNAPKKRGAGRVYKRLPGQ